MLQNYLVYVNSEMFIQNGGNSRLAGMMLAAATFGVLVAGPGMIGFVPIMVVGALIFYLGIALLEEALYDTWGKMNNLEYITVRTPAQYHFIRTDSSRSSRLSSLWASMISLLVYSPELF